MVQNRARSRYKTDQKNQTVTKGVGGVTLASNVYPTYRESETMLDFVTKDWARLKRTGFYLPTSFSEKKRMRLRDSVASSVSREWLDLMRFIPPVNLLNYRCLTTIEPLGSIVFSSLPANPVWISITNGCVVQALNAAWGTPWPTPATPPVTSLSLLEALVKQKVLVQVGDPEYAFGEPMAEIGKTIQLIRNPLGTLKRLAKSFQQSVGNRARTSGNQAVRVAAAWAEYRFAFAPLVRTVDDALNANADRLYRKTRPQFLRAVSTEQASGQSVAFQTTNTHKFPYSGYNGITWGSQRSAVSRIERSVTAGIRYYHADNGSLAALLGLRARDIPVILWETFPLTFLFDRVYNVKSWAQAASSFLDSNVKFTGGWVTKRQTINLTRRYNNIYNAAAPTQPLVKPPRTNPLFTSDFTYDRNPWTPSASEARPPARSKGLLSSLTSTADTAAIITGRMSGAIRNARR